MPELPMGKKEKKKAAATVGGTLLLLLSPSTLKKKREKDDVNSEEEKWDAVALSPLLLYSLSASQVSATALLVFFISARLRSEPHTESHNDFTFRQWRVPAVSAISAVSFSSFYPLFLFLVPDLQFALLGYVLLLYSSVMCYLLA
ncbi:hypothetical protein PIB30_103022 [Stylosanthes scabra]|uniref:Uncharacterized protein n=1 Tax=Stylosanthes scabra TaxID=79078 RepID=A0ABU6VWP6_9FABA|nr:hypothetical protein [Stylosanthes scabra]